MKVKAVQIAKKLGISKATVSLALNGRPGVNEQTREKILACKEQMENGGFVEMEVLPRKTGMLKIIIATRGLNIGYNSEMDLWTDVIAVFEKEAKKWGYEVGITFINVTEEPIGDVVKECSRKDIVGVILHGTELEEDDVTKFETIQNPMVIYDNESTDSWHNCVIADNYLGVNRAVKYLIRRGNRDIVYLAHDKEIYNFKQRRRGFCDALLEYNRNPYAEHSIVPIGSTIESVYLRMRQYLEENKLPDAFVMENYQISIGVMRALRERRIAVPDKVSLIGVDEIPAYMTGDCKLTAVRIPHTERARLAMMMLAREIEKQSTTKSRIMTDCRLVEGESVREGNKLS